MSVPIIPKASIASLTALELEILHLLANGHTVKSIAVSLDRTEASINERLRDARRKTGVGSSRELARRLDAQKIWDRKIDLSSDRASEDTGISLRGHHLSKGTMIMMTTLSVAALALLLNVPEWVAGPDAQPKAEVAMPSPLIGSWALDVARIPEDERPQRVTIAFSVSPENQWTTRVEIVAPDGTAREAVSTAVPDGAAVPVEGMLPVDSVSLRQPAPNTLVMSLGKGGAPFSTRVYTVAKDGQTMTETIIWPGQGASRLETTYFTRIG